MADIHVGDTGTMFRLTIKDKNGDVFSLEDATALFIVFAKPDRTVAERVATLYTDGTDGVMKYITESGDLDQSGRWKVQAVVEKPTGRWSSSVVKFKVIANLE